MKDIIIIAVVAVIIILSAGYVIKAKKSGKKCIGCSCSASCGGSCVKMNNKEKK